MYHLTELIGKVVTIRSVNGDEYIAKLIATTDDKSVLTVENPKAVAINQDQVVLMPFVLTAEVNTVFLSTDKIFTVLETMSDAAKDYTALVKREQAEDKYREEMETE